MLAFGLGGTGGLDADGREVEGKAEGFHARIIQHECDHLDGILYPDRIEEREMFGFIEELQAAGLISPARSRGNLREDPDKAGQRELSSGALPPRSPTFGPSRGASPCRPRLAGVPASDSRDEPNQRPCAVGSVKLGSLYDSGLPGGGSSRTAMATARSRCPRDPRLRVHWPGRPSR